LRQARVERWSSGASYLHRRHPAVKIALALLFLISLASVSSQRVPWFFVTSAALIVCCIVAARLPLLPLLLSAAAVLPFAVLFALVAILAGDNARASLLIVRAYLSALTVLLLAATAPVSDLMAGLEFLRAPRFLLSVMQFLYRYLIVLTGEAAAMRDASLSRAGSLRVLELRQATGAAAILFARAWARAQAVHQAMLSRGFDGMLPRLHQPRFNAADIRFAFIGAAIVIAVRLAA